MLALDCYIGVSLLGMELTLRAMGLLGPFLLCPFFTKGCSCGQNPGWGWCAGNSWLAATLQEHLADLPTWSQVPALQVKNAFPHLLLLYKKGNDARQLLKFHIQHILASFCFHKKLSTSHSFLCL